MKKFLIASVLLISNQLLFAQPWMRKNNTAPVKMADVLANYDKHPLSADRDEQENANAGQPAMEGKNHLYERWKWYWMQHLDKDGYIVSPMKTLLEWQDYSSTHSGTPLAKITSTPSNWIFQGPHLSAGGYGGIGRINVVAFDPVDTNTFYVGSAAGSVWKTTNGGASWTSLYDTLPTLGVGDIKINPLNRRTIYVATGDADAGDAFSSGVIKSVDAGLHWQTTGLNWPATNYYSGRSLLINPQDTNKLILASNAGIFKTNDGGVNWLNVASGDFRQILYKPGDTSILYGAMYVYPTIQIMRSHDGGQSWDTITNFTTAQRICLATCAASPNLVKALVSSNNSSGLQGIYSSSDAGVSYTEIFTNDTSCTNNILGYDIGLPSTSCGGQGWYDLCMAIDPLNPLNVTVGGVNTYHSTDGGYSWQIANQWWSHLGTVSTVHADKHYLAYNTLSHALYETCDGGIYKTHNPLDTTWKDLSSGICITEFYRNAVDNGVDFCIGGAQDNGTKMVEAGLATDLTGGDGMQCLINYGDPHHIWYCAYQNGSVDMTRDSGAHYHSITDTLHGTGAWVTPYSLHPHDTSTLILAYDRVFVSHNNGDSWTPISPIFDTNNYINTMAVSVKNPNYIYTVRNDYTVWKSVITYTTDFGLNWDTVHVPFSTFISDLKVDTRNENIFWVTLSGYSSDSVYRYNVSTHAWANESGTLPNMPVNCMVMDSSTHTRYVGTDAAVFYKDTTMADWALFNKHLPTVHVSDLHINYRTKEIWAATFGRGMWKSNIADIPVSVIAVQKSADAFVVYPDPNNGIFTVHSSSADFIDKEVDMKIVSADGKVVLDKAMIFDNLGRLQVNASQLKPGNYICELSNRNLLSRCRFVVYQR